MSSFCVIFAAEEAEKEVGRMQPGEEKKQLLKTYLECEKIKNLNLDEHRKIGYTYKCLGCGFWTLKQKDFRNALQTIVMEGGDADTNGAVAGALLGCKLGISGLSKLEHKAWLDEKIERYLNVLQNVKGSTSNGKNISSQMPSVTTRSCHSKHYLVLFIPKYVTHSSCWISFEIDVFM